eukprot:gene4057-5800_t
MMVCMVLLLIFLFVRSEEVPNIPTEKITKWEYCQGCKELVNMYAMLSSSELNRMQQEGKKQSSILEANDLVAGICDRKEFEKFLPFMKYACIKIMEEYRIKFLEYFKGSTTASSMLNKADTFHKKKNICVNEVKACQESVFNVANVSLKERNECGACMIVADEIGSLKKSIHKKTKLSDILEGDFCNNLGYNHQPYGWIETTCDEMVEDKLNEIGEVISFHEKVSRTGFTPSETMPQMMCKEFYHCGEQNKKSKNNKTKKKKTIKNKEL